MRQEPRLVFLDETATTTKMTRRRGQRLAARAPFGPGKRKRSSPLCVAMA